MHANDLKGVGVNTRLQPWVKDERLKIAGCESSIDDRGNQKSPMLDRTREYEDYLREFYSAWAVSAATGIRGK